MAEAPAQCAGPRLDVRKPELVLPLKAADCHCHVFGPRDCYPWTANRLYTSPPVSLDDYLAMLRVTGFERGVMVQTGLYGTDNRFIVDAIGAHPGKPRGIALIDEDIADKELRHLAKSGVRGFRVKLGRAWVKLSAPYRTSRGPPPYEDMTPFVRALVEAAPDRLVWGSDWPHVLLETEMPNDGDLVDQIAVWAPDETVRKRILVDNAERLYGFERA